MAVNTRALTQISTSTEFARECQRGRIATTHGRGWLARIIQFVQGYWNHVGVIGFDEFYWNMRSGGLKYTWLGSEIETGHVVGIWQVKEKWASQLTPEDYQKAFRWVKEMYRRKTRYSFLELVTAGWLQVRGKTVCSQFVKVFLHRLLIRFPDVDPMEDQFLTPTEIKRYCDLVATFGA